MLVARSKRCLPALGAAVTPVGPSSGEVPHAQAALTGFARPKTKAVCVAEQHGPEGIA